MEFDYWGTEEDEVNPNEPATIEFANIEDEEEFLREMLPDDGEIFPQHLLRQAPTQVHPQSAAHHGPYRSLKMTRMPAMPMVASTASYHIKDKPNSNVVSSSGEATCAVCGDNHAKLHYGILACYGCKGFFRRTLTGKYRYVCRFGNNCVVDRYQRNSCRFCRFQRCLQVGMDPKAVRPDRDLTGKQRVPRARKRQIDEDLINHMMRLQGDDWSRKIPVEAKMLLMQLLNIESKVAKGDVNSNLMPNERPHAPMNGGANNGNAQQRNVSLRELFENRPSMCGRRTEMCYEPYRMARAEELTKIAHRGALAAVDWVESLVEIGEFIDTEDKVALVKACYAPLTIFNFSARTAQNTKNPDILCLCSYSYVPRRLPDEFDASNHLSNNLIDRTLNELVGPLRKLNLREEEVVPLKAIIILNPNAKGLSAEAQQHVADLRDRIQDMLFQVVKELHPAFNASSRFGNLLLLLPTITTLSVLMRENMQFCQVFSTKSAAEPLLNELFEGNGAKTEESLISSSTHTTSPPLFENPADISLQSIMPDTFAKIDVRNGTAVKTDGFTQTDSSDDCSSPLTSLSSRSINTDYSPAEQNRQLGRMDMSPFPNLLEEDLADADFSPNPTLFDSAGCSDLFGLLQ
ncbi:hypothetical protein M3Y99_01150400 [Aphelenchoides fujianensis]|nr:hypothetical protein M3Y99_01150400 [Aphelenchoides fujianensis]